MKREEIYARLRNSDVFADSVYFDYAWLMLRPKDFEQKTVQHVSEVIAKTINANAFLTFVKKAKQVSIENKANGEVLGRFRLGRSESLRYKCVPSCHQLK